MYIVHAVILVSRYIHIFGSYERWFTSFETLLLYLQIPHNKNFISKCVHFVIHGGGRSVYIAYVILQCLIDNGMAQFSSFVSQCSFKACQRVGFFRIWKRLIRIPQIAKSIWAAFGPLGIHSWGVTTFTFQKRIYNWTTTCALTHGSKTFPGEIPCP